MKTTHTNKKERQNPKVKLGVSRQIAIPKRMFEALHLVPGDYLEMEIKNASIVLTPKTFISKHFVEGLKDIKNGKVTGPFDNADELIKSLDL